MSIEKSDYYVTPSGTIELTVSEFNVSKEAKLIYLDFYDNPINGLDNSFYFVNFNKGTNHINIVFMAKDSS